MKRLKGLGWRNAYLSVTQFVLLPSCLIRGTNTPCWMPSPTFLCITDTKNYSQRSNVISASAAIVNRWSCEAKNASWLVQRAHITSIPVQSLPIPSLELLSLMTAVRNLCSGFVGFLPSSQCYSQSQQHGFTHTGRDRILVAQLHHKSQFNGLLAQRS